jgi:hypothetical protein
MMNGRVDVGDVRFKYLQRSSRESSALRKSLVLELKQIYRYWRLQEDDDKFSRISIIYGDFISWRLELEIAPRSWSPSCVSSAEVLNFAKLIAVHFFRIFLSLRWHNRQARHYNLQLHFQCKNLNLYVCKNSFGDLRRTVFVAKTSRCLKIS